MPVFRLAHCGKLGSGRFLGAAKDARRHFGFLWPQCAYTFPDLPPHIFSKASLLESRLTDAHLDFVADINFTDHDINSALDIQIKVLYKLIHVLRDITQTSFPGEQFSYSTRDLCTLLRIGMDGLLVGRPPDVLCTEEILDLADEVLPIWSSLNIMSGKRPRYSPELYQKHLE